MKFIKKIKLIVKCIILKKIDVDKVLGDVFNVGVDEGFSKVIVFG